MSDVPKTHPRYLSLTLRDKIVAGVEQGITSIHGLIAHGRGEAFDYLIGETTQPFAIEAIHAAAAMLLSAEHPVISVNGNVAALAPEGLIELGRGLNAPLEVNIFHTETGREEKIREHLLKHKARLETSPAKEGMGDPPDVLMPTTEAQLSYIDSNRKFVHPDGIFKADVVFVPLEDGDRCEALRKMGKGVVTVDLNPMSRTAKQASITIVDNVVRALPLLCDEIRNFNDATAQETLKKYSNAAVLQKALQHISRSGNGN
ncbi:phosphopantothenate/pantothenate synthetase [Candidatus Poribacteria bacterium]|nr:MAG: phosphopantothenate/pantothenate synthetase [Candidatus Poribacteria bacterium]